MKNLPSILSWIIKQSFRLLIPAGIILVVIAILIGISGFSIASPSTQLNFNVQLPTIHNTDGSITPAAEFTPDRANIKVFALQNSQPALQTSSSDWLPAPTSLPGLGNQKTLTLQQIAEIISYLLDNNQTK